MFDTHCHINDDSFDNIETSIITTARETGVRYFLIPGTNIENSVRASKIAENFDFVYFAAGIHPTEDLESLESKKMLYQLEELLSVHPKAAAVGEIGLDYYRYTAGSATQKTWFHDQLVIAKKLKLPVIIHNRQATNDLLDVLESTLGSDMMGNIVFHCCPPEDELLSSATKHNIFIGVDGDITYDKKKARFIKTVPIDLLVLETDSPYLTPNPVRETKKFPNVPANLKYVRDAVSMIKNIPIEKVTEITTQNAKSLFGTL